MGETGLVEVDANAAKAVLEKLSSILGISIDLSDLESVKKETEKLMKTIEEAMKGAEPPKDNMTYIR